MKTVINKTRGPIRIPLPLGKTLHLGPGKSGQIRDEAADHPKLKKLVEAGEIQIFDGGEQANVGASGTTAAPHESTHGHGKSTFRQTKGNRGS
jgi:hypothetical protein